MGWCVVQRVRGKLSNSMIFVFTVAVLMLVLSFVIPMRSSLAQGIDENVAVSWQGVIVSGSNTEYYRMNYSDGHFLEVPIHGLPVTMFTETLPDGSKATKANLESVMLVAYKVNPQGLDKTLGTYGNVPAPFRPFSEYPIAYSSKLVNVLANENINPADFGGPDIPPGSITAKKLSGGVLQIDTKRNQNTLIQCKPGQSPPSSVQS